MKTNSRWNNQEYWRICRNWLVVMVIVGLGMAIIGCTGLGTENIGPLNIAKLVAMFLAAMIIGMAFGACEVLLFLDEKQKTTSQSTNLGGTDRN